MDPVVSVCTVLAACGEAICFGVTERMGEAELA